MLQNLNKLVGGGNSSSSSSCSRSNDDSGIFETQRKNLLNRVTDAVHDLVRHHGSQDCKELLVETDIRVILLCGLLEQVFAHGFRPNYTSTFASISRITTIAHFWDYVRALLTESEIKHIESLGNIETSIGRGRSWIRSSINDQTLDICIGRFMRNVKLTREFYSTGSFLLDDEKVCALKQLLGLLKSNVLFAIDVNDSALNVTSTSPVRMSESNCLLSGGSKLILENKASKYVKSTPAAISDPEPVLSQSLAVQPPKTKKKKRVIAKMSTIEAPDPSLEETTTCLINALLPISDSMTLSNSWTEPSCLSSQHHPLTRSDDYGTDDFSLGMCGSPERLARLNDDVLELRNTPICAPSLEHMKQQVMECRLDYERECNDELASIVTASSQRRKTLERECTQTLSNTEESHREEPSESGDNIYQGISTEDLREMILSMTKSRRLLEAENDELQATIDRQSCELEELARQNELLHGKLKNRCVECNVTRKHSIQSPCSSRNSLGTSDEKVSIASSGCENKPLPLQRLLSNSSDNAITVNQRGRSASQVFVEDYEERMLQVSRMNQELLDLNSQLRMEVHRLKRRQSDVRTFTHNASETIQPSVPLDVKWKPDAHVTACEDCKRKFTVARRKHHCRVCGNIFCSACSDVSLPLGDKSRKAVRVCDSCQLALLTKSISSQISRESR